MQSLRTVAIAAAALLAPMANTAAQVPTLEPLDTAAFAVFTGRGATATLDDVVRAASLADVVFLGERHDDRVAHRLQHELFTRLLAPATDAQTDAATRRVVLSLEMFDRDVQTVLDEYLAGLIREDHFLAAARPWPCYTEDYRYLVEAAKAEGVSVVAANAPRRYVNLVSREGAGALDALSAEAKRALPPLPYAAPSQAYIAELRQTMSSHGGAADSVQQANGFLAQALWDATMAHSITQALIDDPDAVVVHLAGAFHVRNGTGVPEHLIRYRPGTRMVTVILEPVEDMARLPDARTGTGDYVILTDTARVRASGGAAACAGSQR